MVVHTKKLIVSIIFILFIFTCGRETGQTGAEKSSTQYQSRLNLLLITLDTTRADKMGYELQKGQTPNLDKLAAGGKLFRRAFATVPMTLPSHTSMMTGLYASEHGVHENARYLNSNMALFPQKLQGKGYHTAAFLAAYPLSRNFGLARGFDHYDDFFPKGTTERIASAVNESVFSYLKTRGQAMGPMFLWVHYFDPHAPYEPPEPYLTRFKDDPYLGEIAFMDEQVGVLLDHLKTVYPEREWNILIVGDHGEGLGDHGESLHGNLLYNSTIQVPLILSGPSITHHDHKEPVSIRRVFNTFLDWAGIEDKSSLMYTKNEIVMGEAMKPFLQYGWQPLKMAVYEHTKTIQSGEIEIFNLDDDPGEQKNLVSNKNMDTSIQNALENYKLPAVSQNIESLTQEEKEQLASLGYVSSDGFQAPGASGPSPQTMTHLFVDLDLGSGFFVQGQYEKAIPIFEEVLKQDPGNFMVCLRIAVGHSALNHEDKAFDFFKKAMKINSESTDLMHYLGMHFFRFDKYNQAEELFKKVLARTPDRLPAIQALALISEIKRDTDSALEWYSKLALYQNTDPKPYLKLGALYMMKGQSQDAIDALLNARDMQGSDFQRNLDLGVCYLALNQFEAGRDCLDQVNPEDPGYPMALFKRAQVSILLREPDQAQRIQIAYDGGNQNTRSLIEQEPLFNGVSWR